METKTAEDGKRKPKNQEINFRSFRSWQRRFSPPPPLKLHRNIVRSPLPLARNEQTKFFIPPRGAFEVHDSDFLKKLAIWGSSTAVCAGVLIFGPVICTIPAAVVLGVLDAHAIELVHEALHQLAFRNTKLNRVVGTVLGIPMLVSFSEYQAFHLPHHQWLGTRRDTEFFDYESSPIKSWSDLLTHAYNPRRYKQVFRKMICAVKGQSSMIARTPVEETYNHHIRQEYRLLTLIVAAAIIVSIVFKTLIVLKLWLLPLLLSAEAAHFLIELPEHLGCDRTTRDVLRNTRVIVVGRFSRWLTNGNNAHPAHHACAKVLIKILPEIQEKMIPYCHHVEPTYWSFFRNVAQGRYSAAAQTNKAKNLCKN